MSGSAPVRMAVGVTVATLATVATLGLPMVAASAVSSAASPAGSGSWFHDPISAAGRAAQVAVPREPARTIGERVRATRAMYRARSGSLAVPLSWARGHQLGLGQSVVMAGSSFSYDDGQPTAGTRQAIRTLTRSLSQVRGVRCEGYADFGGAPGGERPLSLDRARAVCAVIARNTSGLTTHSVGYGIFRPVLIGGHRTSRAANRRVVVEVTRWSAPSTTPPAPAPVATAPGAPRLSRVVAGQTSLTVVFERPSRTGGAAIQRYQVSVDGGTTWRTVTASGPGPFTVTMTGLAPGTRYHVAVRAVNRVGNSPSSNPVTTATTAAAGPVVTVPGAPHLSTAVPTQTSITIGFERPAGDGGAAITAYQVSVDGGTTWRTVPATGTGPFTAVIDGLTPSTAYTVAVRAVNTVGTSARSNTITTTTTTAAVAPTAPVITAIQSRSRVVGSGSQAYDTLTFEAPTSDGGAPITGYQWSTDDGVTWTDLTYAGSGPYSGEVVEPATCTSYRYLIRAVNSAGAGPVSNQRTTSYCPCSGRRQAPQLVAPLRGLGSVRACRSARRAAAVDEPADD
jgi:outer membrane protein OmpA-like peptidoglycan-associated protein